eukprot:TRINITY_DN85398_c0_g1_i1.p1 TRINITY_DN85398_c0_g1~~TRINITY_DN85398_c0_g1_i1.p1  ORF type:complete len:613 (+),score=39.32 TRINITY_DN85398_c0_g1_i1:56-1894(+)
MYGPPSYPYEEYSNYGYGWSGSPQYGAASPVPYSDVYKAEQLYRAEGNTQIGEGKYLCGRCGSYSVTVECRSCRHLYCQTCSDMLHSRGGDYAHHHLRAFNPAYEANKRARKRGTKYDSTAPAIGIATRGAGMGSWPVPSWIAIILSVLIIILTIVAIATNGWTVCTSTEPDFTVGPWKTCYGDNCGGTLNFWASAPCPLTKYKTPVNLTRMFSILGMAFSFFTILLIFVGQTGGWHKLSVVKAGAVCSFIASIFFILAISTWLYANLADVRCTDAETEFPITQLSKLDLALGGVTTTTTTTVDDDGDTSTGRSFTLDSITTTDTDDDSSVSRSTGGGTFALLDINPYGVRGHCMFSYGFYFTWLCAVLAFWAAVLLFDWFKGLPMLAKVAILLIMVTQIFGAIAMSTNYWTAGKLGNASTQAWGGLFRYCVDTPGGQLSHQCYPIGDWVTSTDPCQSKSAFMTMRASMCIALFASILGYFVIFYAHAFRKPKVHKFGGSLIGLVMLVFYILPVILHPTQVNNDHSCGGVTFSKIPFGGTACRHCDPSWSWGLVLGNVIISALLIGLFIASRVGFESKRYLDQKPSQYVEKPVDVVPQMGPVMPPSPPMPYY